MTGNQSKRAAYERLRFPPEFPVPLRMFFCIANCTEPSGSHSASGNSYIVGGLQTRDEARHTPAPRRIPAAKRNGRYQTSNPRRCLKPFGPWNNGRMSRRELGKNESAPKLYPQVFAVAVWTINRRASDQVSSDPYFIQTRVPVDREKRLDPLIEVLHGEGPIRCV